MFDADRCPVIHGMHLHAARPDVHGTALLKPEACTDIRVTCAVGSRPAKRQAAKMLCSASGLDDTRRV